MRCLSGACSRRIRRVLLLLFGDGDGYNLGCVVDFLGLVLVGRIYLVGYLFLVDAGALATFVLIFFCCFEVVGFFLLVFF